MACCALRSTLPTYRLRHRLSSEQDVEISSYLIRGPWLGKIIRPFAKVQISHNYLAPFQFLLSEWEFHLGKKFHK